MDQDISPISAVHHDILYTHILTRLDGPTLASTASTSCHLRALSSDDSLWRDICHQAWPSTAQPRFRHVIDSFPSGHRSFYADSHSTLHRRHLSPRRKITIWSHTLISAVDIRYGENNKTVLSKLHETDTGPESWAETPFRVGLLGPGEALPIPGGLDVRDLACEYELESNMKLSWILIDPVKARSASLTNVGPVSVDRDWSTGDIEVRFGTVLSGERKGELVECGVTVTCGGWDREDLHVKQVKLEIEDVEGNKLGWRDSLVILQEAMENGERTRGGEKGGYEEFSEMKRERREGKLRRERRQEEVGVCTGAVVVIGFWMFATVRFFQLLCSYFLFLTSR